MNPHNGEHSEAQFQQWLEKMPTMHLEGMVTVAIPLTLRMADWAMLVQGAARNGMTVKEALEFLLTEFRDNSITEWINREAMR